MDDLSTSKQERPASEASIRRALDAIDKSELKGRVLNACVIAGALAVAVWFDLAARNSNTPAVEMTIRAVAILVAMLTLIAVKLLNRMNKNTQTILRAIAEIDSKTRRQP